VTAYLLETSELACERGGRHLFDGLSVRAEAGTLVRVAGPNGTGKTSLLRILCGLLDPSQGEVRWNGSSIRRLREDYWQELVYIGHLNGVKDDLTVRENLRFALDLAGSRTSQEACDPALTAFGLGGYENTPARFLSQGQRRRIALARLHASAATPLWILDEPFSALDTRGTETLGLLISDHLKRGRIAVLTTHQEVTIAAPRELRIDLAALGAGATQ
jgi:heme exporter protein A